MAKRTKGTWKVYQDNMAQITSVVTEDGVGFFVNTIATINRKDANFVANSHLIAAAPDMFEALNNICKAASFCHADAGLKIWIDKASEALAKAEGKE